MKFQSAGAAQQETVFLVLVLLRLKHGHLKFHKDGRASFIFIEPHLMFCTPAAVRVNDPSIL